jgi:hypothetical protein
LEDLLSIPCPIYPFTMSSYLLLRNNKETGPFTIDEIKEMNLKAYDLLWVVGKSAAWRYPGEIEEIKPFAPAVPDQMADVFKPVKTNSTNIISKETSSQKSNFAKTVYVNFPAEKRQTAILQQKKVINEDVTEQRDPAYDFSDLYKKKQRNPVGFSGRILWFGIIILLFGAGLFTGFIISDRGKYFTKDEISPQTGNSKSPVSSGSIRENPNIISSNIAGTKINEQGLPIQDLSKKTTVGYRKNTVNATKKNPDNTVLKTDSATAQRTLISNYNLNDSLKKNAAIKSEMLYEKIKAHPENYINLVTGHYSTGVFGGISTFPITVTNSSSMLLEQVVVSVNYIQSNEKIFKTENLYFNGLESGESVTLKAPKSSRGVKIATRIQVMNSVSTGNNGSAQ